MDEDLKEALEALHDFRQFWFDAVAQTRLGANHHNPMWARVSAVLGKHGMNDSGTGVYLRPDPEYRKLGY